MNLDSLSFTLSQISYLVANLSKRNFRESCQEISLVSILHLVRPLGPSRLYFHVIPRQSAPPLSSPPSSSPPFPAISPSCVSLLPPIPLASRLSFSLSLRLLARRTQRRYTTQYAHLARFARDSIFLPVFHPITRDRTCPRGDARIACTRALQGELARCNALCRAP